MASAGEQGRSTGSSSSAAMLLEGMKLLGESQGKPGPKKAMNSELWHACAGPLVSLPQPGSLVYYFPQGHSEQVTASTRKSANVHIPNYPSLSSQMMCQVHSVTLHADRDSDEIYAQMTLQPVISELDVFPIPDLGHTRSKHPNEFFCKTLTASDTSTHGGFSVPRRAAEKLFPQLDYSMQPPNQELIVRDLHDNLWTFRHIYRGQPKRHLLTTGWSSFVGAKRLKAGDSVLFIRDAKSQLLLGVRRTNRQQTTMPSSVLSTDSMHIGVLAAAAHAAASRSPFTVYYNPRACLSEFVIPLAKYHKAAYTQVSIGMRFGMMFETEESTKRRYMGTILGISDYDPLRWPNSKWRNLQVEWDEHGYGERPDRVSVWEIETPESLFVFPTSTSLKRQCLPGFVVPSMEIGFANTKTPLQSPENGNADLNPIISGFDSGQLKKMLLEPQITIPNRHVACHSSVYASIFHSIRSNNMSGTFPSVQAITDTPRSSVSPEGEVDNTVLQQKHQFPLASIIPSQSTLSQKKSCPHHVDQQGVDLVSDLCRPWEPHEQLVGESIPDQKLQDQNSHSENKNIKQNISETQLIHGTISEKSTTAPSLVANQVDGHSQNSTETSCQQLSTEVGPQVSKEMNGENSLDSANTENVASYKDHALQIKEQSAPLLLDQQLEANISHLPMLETIQSSDTPDNIMQHNELHSNQCFDQDGWMLNSSSHHSSSGSLEASGPLLGSCKPDPLLLSVSHDSTNSLGDISNIMNQENMNAGNMFRFSGNSDLEASQCLPTVVQEHFGTQELNLSHEERVASGIMSSMHDLAFQEEDSVLHFMSNMSGVKDFPNDTNLQNEFCNYLNFEASNGSMIVDPCFPNTVLESFGTLKGPGVHIPSEFCFGNSSSNQDVQSQVTSASLIDSQVFSLQDIPDSSGGTSSGSIDANEYNILNKGPKKQVSPQPLRTYTKVQKLGSVGRSIDVTRFRNYHELKSAVACMFGLEGQLEDPNGSEWKLVYVDYENDVLLVGDDPWEEFVNCVRCIRILSPSEVQQMSEEGMQFINSSAAFHHVSKSSCLDNNSHAWNHEVP